jgi:hypothetical protein
MALKKLFDIDIDGYISSNFFRTKGGNSSQFLKGDGTLDPNSYALASNIPTNNNQLTNGAGYISSFDITSQTDPKYLRSDINDSFSGNLSNTLGSGSTITLYDNNSIRNNRIIIGADINGAYVNSTFSSNGTQNLILAGLGGNVGIGTTSPSAKLDIYGDSNSADNMIELINSKYDSTNTAGETGILFGWNDHVAARITAFKEGTVNRTGFKIIGEAGFNVPTTIATFRSTGNVGIGNTNPQSLLDVGTNGNDHSAIKVANNTIRLGGFNEAETLGINTNNLITGSTFGGLIQGAQAGHLLIGIRDNDEADSVTIVSGGGNFITDNTYDTVVATFKCSGNVGIGTTSPNYKLDVNGTGRFVDDLTAQTRFYLGSSTSNLGITFHSALASIDTSAVNCQIAAADSGGAGGFIAGDLLLAPRTSITSTNTRFFMASGAQAMMINPTGNVSIGNTNNTFKLDVSGTGRFTSTVTATNFILSSDKRLKKNIKDVDTKEVIVVDWKTFELKEEEGQKRYGVVAQELEENHPEFVRTDKEGIKSVAYIDLLIAKIAELEARLEKAGI